MTIHYRYKTDNDEETGCVKVSNTLTMEECMFFVLGCLFAASYCPGDRYTLQIWRSIPGTVVTDFGMYIEGDK